MALVKRRAITLGTTRRGRDVPLPETVRSTHMHVLGASGRGKSKFLEGLIRRDILNRNGLCLIDPHGTLYTEIIRWLETKGIRDDPRIVLFDPSADSWRFGFDPLQFAHSYGKEISFGVDTMVNACAQVWGGENTNQTPRLKRMLRCVFHALAEKRLTLHEALYLVTTDDLDGVRGVITEDLDNQVIRRQWDDVKALRPDRRSEILESTMNRLMEFLAGDIVKQTVGQQKHVLDLSRAMDEGQVVLVNLAPNNRLSDDNARLLGTLLVNDLFVRARHRPPKSRPFYVYIDECARYVTDDVARILDEGRKFGLHLILAHQHLAQLRAVSDVVYSAVMTNAQSKVVFGGLTVEDARVVAENLFIGRFDPKRVKTYRPAVVQYLRTWFENRSTTTATSASSSSGWGASSGTAEGSVLVDGAERSASLGAQYGFSESGGESVGSSYAEAFGQSEGLEPVIEWLPEYYNLEEQLYLAMSTMVNQPTRHAIAKLPGKPPVEVETPFISDAVARDQRVTVFREQHFERSPFCTSPEEVETEIGARYALLAEAARAKRERRDPDDYLE